VGPQGARRSVYGADAIMGGVIKHLIQRDMKGRRQCRRRDPKSKFAGRDSPESAFAVRGVCQTRALDHQHFRNGTLNICDFRRTCRFRPGRRWASSSDFGDERFERRWAGRVERFFEMIGVGGATSLSANGLFYGKDCQVSPEFQFLYDPPAPRRPTKHRRAGERGSQTRHGGGARR